MNGRFSFNVMTLKENLPFFKYLDFQGTVWYKTKFGSQNLATKFGNHLCMATKIGNVTKKLLWFIRHLCDGLYISYSNFWNLYQTFGPSHRKCPTCLMIFVNTELVANVSSNFHHLVNTGLVVGYFFKLLPITVAHTCKLDTIWVVYISPIGNGSIRLQSPLTHYMPCEILHPVVLGSSVSSLALILKTINLFVPCTLIFWKSYQSW